MLFPPYNGLPGPAERAGERPGVGGWRPLRECRGDPGRTSWATDWIGQRLRTELTRSSAHRRYRSGVATTVSGFMTEWSGRAAVVGRSLPTRAPPRLKGGRGKWQEFAAREVEPRLG